MQRPYLRVSMTIWSRKRLNGLRQREEPTGNNWRWFAPTMTPPPTWLCFCFVLFCFFNLNSSTKIMNQNKTRRFEMWGFSSFDKKKTKQMWEREILFRSATRHQMEKSRHVHPAFLPLYICVWRERPRRRLAHHHFVFISSFVLFFLFFKWYKICNRFLKSKSIHVF